VVFFPRTSRVPRSAIPRGATDNEDSYLRPSSRGRGWRRCEHTGGVRSLRSDDSHPPRNL